MRISVCGVLAVTACLRLAGAGQATNGIDSSQLIDRYIFGALQRDAIRPAPPSSDPEFLRRIYLDLTGRLPEPDAARQFLADTNPAKRSKLIDSLIPPLPVTSMRSISADPFLDRWAYFFNDLFRNGQLLGEGINTFTTTCMSRCF